MDAENRSLYNPNMTYYDDLAFFRFNHLPDHHEEGERIFVTHALNFIAQGAIRWWMEGQEERVIKAPAAYWTWPGPRFNYGNTPESPWEHYYVSFTGDRIKRWRKTGLFIADRNVLPIKELTSPELFLASFEELLSLLARYPTGSPEAVWRLEGLLLQLHNQPPAEAVFHPRREEVMDLVQRIEENPERNYKFAKEAAELAMSPTHLRRLMNLFTGYSPTAFVNQCRLSRAASLLRTENYPIKQIAEETGFGDVFYFTKLFTREHTLSPAAYRKAFQRPE